MGTAIEILRNYVNLILEQTKLSCVWAKTINWSLYMCIIWILHDISNFEYTPWLPCSTFYNALVALWWSAKGTDGL